MDDVFRTISETPTSLLSIRTRAILGIGTTIVEYRFCALPGTFFPVSSCPESVRLLIESYLRVNVVFAPLEVNQTRYFSLRQLQEKSVELSRLLYVLFIDLTKAFDTVSRSALYNLLKLLAALKRYFPFLYVPREHEGESPV